MTIEKAPSVHGGCTASCPFPAATGLGLAGFFFPLLKPVLGMGSHPPVRQQGFQRGGVAGRNGRNPPQHVGEVRPHVHSVPPGTLHQRVERRRRQAKAIRLTAPASKSAMVEGSGTIATRKPASRYGFDGP